MFGWEFPPHISGGLGTACLGLTTGLASQQVEVTFVLPRLSGDPGSAPVRLVGANRIRAQVGSKELAAFSDRIRLLEVDSPLRPYLSTKEYQQLVEKEESRLSERIMAEIETELIGGYGPDMMGEIVRYSLIAGILARTEEFDVIHSHDWMTSLAGIEAKQASGKPLVVHAHALEFDRSGENINQDVYNIERAGLEAADRVVAVSHLTKDCIVNRYGISPDKIRVVHNAVSKERRFRQFQISRTLEEKIVLFLGRITFQKGPDYFVEAANQVLKKYSNVRFVMAGSGDMFPKMVERAAELRLCDRFHFTGFLTGADVERMYAMSDLYVMPSVSEPFGIAPLEAMVHNVPIIVSKQSGVAEILDWAAKVDFWDVDALAAKIVEILRLSREERRALIEQGSEQLKTIKWEIAAEKLVAVYQEISR
jgi:glycosyltransferase involved in cell wall biosynthesis